MNTVFMRCVVFCTSGTNLSLRVYVSSSKDKLNLAINASYSKLTETKLILLPPSITAIFLQFIQNYLQHQVASKCVWLSLIINPESAVEKQISKSMKLSGVDNGKNSPHSSFLTLQSDWSHKFVDRWKAEMVKCQKLDCEACLNQPAGSLLRGSLSLQKP